MSGSAIRLFASAACASACVAVAAPAMAQDVPMSTIDRCREMQTQPERIACLEGALAAAESFQGLRRGPAASRAPSSDFGEPAPRSGGGGGFLSNIPFFGGDDDDEPRASADGLGAEQLAGYQREGDGSSDNPVSATIVSFEERVPGQMQFELDNGQVWRQLSGDSNTVRLSQNDDNQVEMWRSWAGGYRMRLVGHRMVVQVERVR